MNQSGTQVKMNMRRVNMRRELPAVKTTTWLQLALALPVLLLWGWGLREKNGRGGAGLAAFGPGYGHVLRFAHTDFILDTSAAISTDASYVGAAQVTFALPALRFGERTPYQKPSAREKFGIPAVERPMGEDPLDAKMSFTFGYRKFDAREQDFYGLGPNTSLSSHASYGLLLSNTYAKIDNPVASWSSIGFNLSMLQPRVTSSINTAVPQLRAVYNATTTPGFNSSDDYMRYEPYLLLRVPPHRSLFNTLRVGYAFYQALGDSAFSFQRLSATDTTFLPLWVPSHGTPKHRNWLLNGVSMANCYLASHAFAGTTPSRMFIHVTMLHWVENGWREFLRTRGRPLPPGVNAASNTSTTQKKTAARRAGDADSNLPSACRPKRERYTIAIGIRPSGGRRPCNDAFLRFSSFAVSLLLFQMWL